MSEIERAFLNLAVDDLAASRAFYERLGYRLRFESPWFVQLAAPGREALELGLLRRDHPVVPAAARSAPAGVMLTVVVPDVDAAWRSLREAGVEILEPPRDLFYGQRRMLLVDPDGQLVDVSSECPPDPGWLASLSG